MVLVVSAMGKETDELLRMAAEVSKIRPGREMDMLITAGERKACALMCMALADLGVRASSFTGSQAGFTTDTNHENAKILEIRPTRIEEALADGVVPVVAGSQGVSTSRDVTFLGRGGSDTTAVALAQVLNAGMCELYTDVSGVFSADPRVAAVGQKTAGDHLRRVAGDDRHRLPQAGDALGGGGTQLRRAAACALRLHLGTGNAGGAELPTPLNCRGGAQWNNPSFVR